MHKKYVIVDFSSNAVLCVTKEVRVPSLCKTTMLDIETIPILEHMYPEQFKSLTNEYIKNNNVIFYNNEFKIVENFSSNLKQKKEISLVKLSLLESLIYCADIKMSSHHHFFDSHMLFLVNENNIEVMKEYALIRKIDLEEAKKDLLLKKSAYDMHVIKIQALLDKWVDLIIFENNIQILKDYKNSIIQDFFFR